MQRQLEADTLTQEAEPRPAIARIVPKEKNRAGRLENLDALRGVCAILVVLQHSLPRRWEGAGLFRADPTLNLDLGRLGVAAFFLISGYLIPFSIPRGDKPILSFWIARFFRLWPVYWLSIILTLLTASSKITPTLKVVFANSLMLQGFLGIPDMSGTFWTLQIELVFYFVITAMIALRMVNDLKYFKAGFYIMIALSLMMSAARGYFEIRLPVALPMALTLMFFAASLRNCRLVGKRLPHSLIVTYVVTLVPICLMGYTAKLTRTDDPYRWMLAYLAGLGLFLVFEKAVSAPKIVVFLGAISYSIYLLHPSVMKIRETLFDSASPLEAVVFILAITIFISWISYRLVELPCQRLGKKIIRKVQSIRSTLRFAEG